MIVVVPKLRAGDGALSANNNKNNDNDNSPTNNNNRSNCSNNRASRFVFLRGVVVGFLSLLVLNLTQRPMDRVSSSSRIQGKGGGGGSMDFSNTIRSNTNSYDDYDDYVSATTVKNNGCDDDAATDGLNVSSSSSSSSSFSQSQQHYSWMGNHWRPPLGVPLYSPDDMRHAFVDSQQQQHGRGKSKKKNILWIGDSTGRQDYVTLYNILIAKNKNTPKVGKKENANNHNGNNTSISNQNDNNNIHDIATAMLDYGINVNKNGRITEDCPKDGMLLCRTLSSSSVSSEGNTTTLSSSSSSHIGSGDNDDDAAVAYDFSNLNCMSHVVDFLLENKQQLANTYSIIVISAGIWEVVRPWDCGRKGPEYVLEVLDVIDREFHGNNTQTTSSTTHIFWKVHCGAGNENDDQMQKTETMQQLTRDWFAAQRSNRINNNNNLHMIDLAQAMQGRIYGPSRIQGDLAAHLGSLSRTLFLQMLTNEVLRQERCAT